MKPRRRFDNLITCCWLILSARGRLWDQRLRESGLTIKEFIEQEQQYPPLTGPNDCFCGEWERNAA